MNIIHLLYMELNTNNNIKKNIEIINKLYGNQTLFEQNGGSFLLFIVLMIIFWAVNAYCYIKIHIQPIKDNWVEERCKLYNIPFAGIINKPNDMSITEYTSSNFNFCIQNILASISGTALEPLTYVISLLKNVSDDTTNSINAVRGMFDKSRTFFQSISTDIMGRLMNIMIPLQQIIVSVKDFIAKIQGVMTGSLFTLLGSYYALKSLMGAILQFIITILIVMAVMIAFFWIIPFTWGAAISLTTIFIALSIPMIVIVAFMMDVLHVQTNLSIPSLPTPSMKCFDKNTLILMENGFKKRIIDISVGEKLINGNEVIAKIIVETKGSTMYSLNGVIVSDTHLVNHLNKWIRVSEHPRAIKVESYCEPYLYCLNTSKKHIFINDILFSDWDEMIIHSNNVFTKLVNENLCDEGFINNTTVKLQNNIIKKIQDIKIGDNLDNGGKVYGIVELIKQPNKNRIYNHCLGKNSNIEKKELKIDEYLDKSISESEIKLYHLLTNTPTFDVNGTNYYKYNGCIDYLIK